MVDDANAAAAYKRDGGWCQWCLHRVGTFNKGGTPHHVFGRDWDQPEHQITLCQTRKDGSTGCHNRFHDTGEILREQIIELCIEAIWDGDDKTPEDW